MVGMVLPSVGGISTHVKVILSGSQPTAVLPYWESEGYHFFLK